MAVPTTSMDESASNIWGISFRIKAESSTTSTRTLLILVLPQHREPAGRHRHRLAGGRTWSDPTPADVYGRRVRRQRADSGSTQLFHLPEWKRRSPDRWRKSGRPKL